MMSGVVWLIASLTCSVEIEMAVELKHDYVPSLVLVQLAIYFIHDVKFAETSGQLAWAI